jgi:hypothetical protein
MSPIISNGGGKGFANPMTTADDLIVGGAAGAPTRLAVGPDGEVLTVSNVGAVGWAAPGGVAAPVIFNANGTWTPSTTGQAIFAALVVGGGGGGGGTSGAGSTGGTGGGGGQVLDMVYLGNVSAQQMVTVGGGGAGANGAGFGTQGGTTSIGALVSAAGGFGGNHQQEGGAPGYSIQNSQFSNNSGVAGNPAGFGGLSQAPQTPPASAPDVHNGGPYQGGARYGCGGGGGGLNTGTAATAVGGSSGDTLVGAIGGTGTTTGGGGGASGAVAGSNAVLAVGGQGANAAANTGNGGGGGGGSAATAGIGGNGGSGIVVIYQLA